MKAICRITSVILFLIIFSNCFLDYRSQTSDPLHLDFSQINWQKSPPIDISGSWEFYWMQLLEPKDFESPSQSSKKSIGYGVPFRPWNLLKLDDKNLSPTGYATYRIKLKVQDSKTPKSFSIFYQHLFSASKLYVNGVLLHEKGKVSSDLSQIIPVRVNSIEEIIIDDESLDIVLQIANRDFFRGGPRGHFLISSPEQMRIFEAKNLIIEVFTLGLLFGAFFYHLSFYFLNPKQKVFLYFSLLCFTFLIRIPFLNSKIYLYFFDIIDFEVFTNLMHLLGVLSLLSANVFLNHLFSGSKVKYINEIFYIGAIFAILSPLYPGFFKYFFNLIYLVFYVLLFFIHSIILLYRHRNEKRAHILMGIGLFGLSVFCSLAIFLNFFGLQSGVYLLLGFGIYVTFQSISLSKYFAYAIESRASIELQLQEENQLALTKQRAEMQLMVHDNLGAGLTDLKVVIDRKIREASEIQSNHWRELRTRVDSIIQSLRNHLLQIEDLNLTYESFITGLNVTLLRRYSEVGRELEFSISESTNNLFQRVKITAKNREYFQNLYFLLYEICTNDIKYGKEESTWILEIQNYNLLIYQKNLIKSKSDSSSFSLKSVSTRIESLGGTVSNRVIGNQFELNLKIPWINELN